MLLGVVLALVDAHEEGLHVALARGGDHDLLGPRVEVALGLVRVREQTRALEDVVDAQVLPGEVSRVALGHDALHGITAHHQDVVVVRAVALLRSEAALEAAVDRVVLHLVREVVGVGGDVDHTDDVDLLAEQALIAESLEDQATDAAETVDTNADCHLFDLRVQKQSCSLSDPPTQAQPAPVPSP